MKRTLLTLFALFLISTFFTLALAAEYDAGGYRWSVDDIRQNGDQIKVSGRVYGPDCRTLQVDIYTRSQDGHTSHTIATVENADPNGRLFTAIGRAYYYGDKWQITNIFATCMAR